jgi:hypothetical protein
MENIFLLLLVVTATSQYTLSQGAILVQHYTIIIIMGPGNRLLYRYTTIQQHQQLLMVLSKLGCYFFLLDASVFLPMTSMTGGGGSRRVRYQVIKCSQ